MNTKELNSLEALNPCSPGFNYARKQNSLKEAWDNCSNDSWMWWYLRKKKLVTVELSVKYAEFCADSVSDLKRKVAADAAYVVAYDAAAADAAHIQSQKQADYLRTIIPNPFISIIIQNE